ncbi:MAG: hypothetical protein WDA02_01630 [Saccharofermentanales bacterium]|jgi:hypothetical protein
MDKDKLRGVWQALNERLSAVSFEAIWPGFSPYDFALYTPELACIQGDIRGKPPSFIGNTALAFEGRPLAIWQLEETGLPEGDELDRLAANLIHEMFHAFQGEKGESRFPRDLELLLYPYREDLVAWTIRESRLLSQADPYTKENSGHEAGRLLEAVAAVRQEKDKLAGSATLNEYRTETAEGLAEYAGYRGLCQINQTLAEKTLAGYREQLSSNLHLFDIRRRCYFSGVLLAVALERAGYPLAHDLACPRTLWEELAIPSGKASPLTDGERARAASLMQEEEKRRAGLLASFQEEFKQESPLHALICGYDPMNLTRVGDFLISTHFLMTEKDGQKQPWMGRHLFRMKKGHEIAVEAVYFE